MGVSFFPIMTGHTRNSRHSRSGGLGLEVPGRELADAIDGVIGDALEQHALAGLQVSTIYLRGADQGADDRRPLAALDGSSEQVVLPPQGKRPHSSLGGIVVQAGEPVAQQR
jgi:hypothetical protein